MEISISQQEALWLIIACGLLILFLATGFVLAYNFYKRRITDQLVKSKEQEIKHKSELLEAQIEGEDRERDRIASELHDEVGSRIAILRLHLVGLLTKKQKELDKDSMQVLGTIDQLLESAQRISHGLKPPELQHAGLVAAIQGVIEAIQHSDEIDINFPSPEIPHEIWNQDVDVSIYKIIFELLHNTIKHAEASKINLKIDCKEGYIFLDYSDNGVGFELNKSYLDGLGLRSIVSRSQFINAEYDFISNLNQGFQFKLKAKY